MLIRQMHLSSRNCFIVHKQQQHSKWFFLFKRISRSDLSIWSPYYGLQSLYYRVCSDVHFNNTKRIFKCCWTVRKCHLSGAKILFKILFDKNFPRSVNSVTEPFGRSFWRVVHTLKFRVRSSDSENRLLSNHKQAPEKKRRFSRRFLLTR